MFTCHDEVCLVLRWPSAVRVHMISSYFHAAVVANLLLFCTVFETKLVLYVNFISGEVVNF